MIQLTRGHFYHLTQITYPGNEFIGEFHNEKPFYAITGPHTPHGLINFRFKVLSYISHSWINWGGGDKYPLFENIQSTNIDNWRIEVVDPKDLPLWITPDSTTRFMEEALRRVKNKRRKLERKSNG